MNTKRALASSLKSLSRSLEPGKNITVGEIVRSAGANRNTFYYHFADVQALILWTLNDDIFSHILEHDPIEGTAIRELIVDYMYDNAKFLNFAYHYIGIDAFNDHYVNELYPIIHKYIESVCAKRGWKLDERQTKFINGFFAEHVGSLYLLQFRRPNRFPKDSAHKYLELIFDHVLPGVLEQASALELS
jgi:AcrR family transcriptional regulator